MNLLVLQEFGDTPGHPFRGNQYQDGAGGGGILSQSQTGQVWKMKYLPRTGATNDPKVGTPRLDRTFDALRTGARPLGPERAAALNVGDKVGVVVNGDAWHAEIGRAHV